MNGSISKKAEDHITRLMGKVEAFKDWLVARSLYRSAKSNSKESPWPVLPGAYVVGDRHGPVAICTLTSHQLFTSLAHLPGVAIAGRAYSANLGIEKMIANVIANPSIRFLLICGKESPYFQAGQALEALFVHGVTPEGHIVNATGHMPELHHTPPNRIDHFRKQVELVNCIGETGIESLAATVQALCARNSSPYQDASPENEAVFPRRKEEDGFRPIRLGGHRESFAFDPMGFFIITLKKEVGEILVHHYWPDNSPAHVVSGRNGEAILLALLREELISQKSHAGYLGAELAKAETAIRLDLHYEQDRPLRSNQETAIHGAG